MVVVTAPEFWTAVNVPVAAVRMWLLMMLLFMFSVATAAELEIGKNAPVPVLVPAITLFVVIASVPLPPEFIIPL